MRRRWSLARVLTWYYLATPLFVLVDVYVSAPIRVAALGDSPWRWAYYAGALGCGVVCRLRPGWAPAVGMVESATNLFLLVLGILLPIWSLPDDLLAGRPLTGPFDEVGILNFLLSGAVFIGAFHRSQASFLAAGSQHHD